MTPALDPSSILLDRYLATRHREWLQTASDADSRTIQVLRRTLARLDSFTGAPHRLYLRTWLKHRIDSLPSAALAQLSESDFRRWELAAIDGWTVTWPVAHAALLYVIVFQTLSLPARVSSIAVSAAGVCLLVSVFRTLDILVTLVRLHFLAAYVPHHRPRAIVGTACQLVDITITFAILFVGSSYVFGDALFAGNIALRSSVATPLYYSFGVLSNIGVEGIYPAHSFAQVLTIFEHGIGLLLLVVIFQNVFTNTVKPSPAQIQTPNASVSSVDPVLYASFLDQFRHPSEFIEHLFERFVPTFQERSPVLDVGCGRGEFLNVMRRAGIRAYGIDTNAVLVHRCRAAGLQVIEEDWRTHLAALPDAALGGIFSAQLVEHMDGSELIDFLRTCSRKLQPGGRLAVETLNTCVNTLVTKFFVDPTHRFPLHPDVLRFLVIQIGFADVRVEFYNSPPVPDLAASLSLSPGSEESESLTRLTELFFGPHYYCVIGSKSPGITS